MEGSLTRKRRVTREFTLGALVAAYIVFLALTTGFGSTSGLFSMMLDVSPTIVGAIALSLIIFTGNIDISAGTILGFVGFVAAILAKAGLPIVVWLPAGLLTGMFLAGLNGWLSVTFRVPTIVVTLAMNMVHIGFYVTFLPNAGWVLNLSDSFTALGQGRFFGLVPYIFVIAVAVAALLIWVVKYTRFGKALYAVGGNRQASIYAGINPDRTVLVAFLVEGLLLGVAGHPEGHHGEQAHALGLPGTGDDLHRGGRGRRRQHHGRLRQAARCRVRRAPRLPAQHHDDLPRVPGLLPVRPPGNHHPDRGLHHRDGFRSRAEITQESLPERMM